MAATTNTVPSNFSFAPGAGMAVFNKRMAADVTLWQGSMTLPQGEPGQITLLARTKNGKPLHYEATIRKISEAKGEVWPIVAEFKIPPFAGKFSQDVKIPKLGAAKVWAAVTKSTGRSSIRIQVLDAQLPNEPVM